MKRPTVFLFIIASIMLVVDAAAQPCQQVFFNQQPGWVTHAEWSGHELLIVDNLRADVLGFKQDGRPASQGFSTARQTLSAYPYDPVELKRAQSGWILQLDASRFVRFGDPPRKIVDLEGVKVQIATPAAQEAVGAEQATLRKVHQWVPAADDLVLIADLTTFASPSEKQRNRADVGQVHLAGLVRVKLTDPTSAVLLGDPWPFRSPTWRRHRVILPTLAASPNGRVFFLKLDEEPQIYFNNPVSDELGELKGKLVPLTNSPEAIGADSPPDIPDVSLQKLTLIMAGVESTPFVAGLYFWEGHLYVLHREPTVGRSTKWSLIKVNPETGEALGRSALPTRANHLVVAPGDPWAFVEKGPYLGLGNQKIPSAYLIDAEAIHKFQPTLCSNGD